MTGNIAIWIEEQSQNNCPHCKLYTCSPKLVRTKKIRTHSNNPRLKCDKKLNQLHLNFWKFDKSNILDIGLKFPKTKNGVKIYCFVEGDQESITYSDLGTTLHNHEHVRYAVFNDIINMASCEKSIKSRHRIHAPGNMMQYSHDGFCLVDIDEFKHIPCAAGSLTEIHISECKQHHCCNSYYIRFRLTGKWIDSILKREVTQPTRLAHYTAAINVLDLRINTIRTLPSLIVNRMNKYHPHFDTIQCFLMCKSSDVLSLSMAPHNSVRVLERSPWSQYIKNIDEVDGESDILAYQWKEKDKDDFLLFVKLLSYDGFIIKALIILALAGFISWIVGTILDVFFLEDVKAALLEAKLFFFPQSSE